MTFSEYLRVFRGRWITVLIAIFLGIGGAAAIYAVKKPDYTAYLQMYVSARPVDDVQVAFDGAQLSEQRIKSYTKLATSPRVTNEVVRKLNLPMTQGELASRMKAASDVDAVIIDLSVTDNSPERATNIANTAAEVLAEVVDELERPGSSTGVAPVAMRTVEPATVPMEASSTGLSQLLVLGMFVGLALGVGAALVRDALDTSISTLSQLSETTGAPNLGCVGYDGQARKRPLIVHDDPSSPPSEALRQLRTNLQFIDVDNPHKVVVVTSSVPGEGKTTTLVNLAITLASAGSRVLVVEGDLRRPRAAELLGLPRRVGLSNVLVGRVAPHHAIQPWGGGRFDVLASGPLPPNPSELLASRQMQALLNELRSRYDVVLLDTPPLLPVTDAAAVAAATDGVVFVCRYRETKRPQVATAVEALHAVGAPVLGTVFTMLPSSRMPTFAASGFYPSQETGTDDQDGLAPPELPVARRPEIDPRDRAHGNGVGHPPAGNHPSGPRHRPPQPPISLGDRR
jgi:capsular exopolysaccharide synthesis family protein